ncbi:MAG: bifunctional alpha,alpha-trehalose-phosphate synthase (UDP-forming)/trehalose-phosphatase [Chlamydiota bacterium]
MARTIIISNRLPLTVTKDHNSLHYNHSVGGLATGLQSFIDSREVLWIGWPGINADVLDDEDCQSIRSKMKANSYYPVFITEDDLKAYYGGFCNKTIWPLFHYFNQYTVYDSDYWEHYVAVNEKFCKVVMDIWEPGDVIWVHDYQLMLLPQMIRKHAPDASIGFFLHIPFPSFETFRLLPWRNELLNGILGSDQIGFHTYDYANHFLNSASRILGCEPTMGELNVEGRVVKVDTFPMGIDYDKYATAPLQPETQRAAKKIENGVSDRKIILSVDRLDYTKGIVGRLEAYEQFLHDYPDFHEKVVLILVAVPSRTDVERYQKLRSKLERRISNINGRYGTIGWVPVWYIFRPLEFYKLIALYKKAEVALVTPLRDGMNLVAKEFVAVQQDKNGVLILSEMAGAASELPEALTVNANDKQGISSKIHQALLMPLAERSQRMEAMQHRLAYNNVIRWAEDFIDSLQQVKDKQNAVETKKLVASTRKEIVDSYYNSQQRLILLDYDGTLVDIVEKPEMAKPDQKILELLKTLSEDPHNRVVVISGRDRYTLDEWLGGCSRLNLVAEHGAWKKSDQGTWVTSHTNSVLWKDKIWPILERFTLRTPGSFIEDKDFSLVWHFRNCTQELAEKRKHEVRAALQEMTVNLDLGVFEGKKILEIKNAGIGKNSTVNEYLAQKQWDFILAAGDDYTDEDMFEALPSQAYSVNVGNAKSKAKYYLPGTAEMRELLTEISRSTYVNT